MTTLLMTKTSRRQLRLRGVGSGTSVFHHYADCPRLKQNETEPVSFDLGGLLRTSHGQAKREVLDGARLVGTVCPTCERRKHPPAPKGRETG